MGKRFHSWCRNTDFYHDKSKKFAALGHPITDVDTGTILTIDSGEIVPSSIVSIKKV
ncbi:hypothetical protein JTS96_06065 [Clostridium botulinum]|nr:hypothetical protein [Clostridium botulinum]